jgi:hypothetical protein
MTLLYSSPNITGFLGLFTYMNTITGNWFWTLVTLAIFIVAYVSLSYYGFKNAILSSLFVTTVLAILLRMGSLVGDPVVGVCALLLAILSLYTYANREG